MLPTVLQVSHAGLREPVPTPDRLECKFWDSFPSNDLVHRLWPCIAGDGPVCESDPPPTGCPRPSHAASVVAVPRTCRRSSMLPSTVCVEPGQDLCQPYPGGIAVRAAPDAAMPCRVLPAYATSLECATRSARRWMCPPGAPRDALVDPISTACLLRGL